MAFQNSAADRRNKNELVVSVGSHAFINWSPGPGQARQGVPMLDGAGQALSNDLSDGQEVEILSWRPRAREGLSYQIRRLSDDSQWWVAATYLRRAAVAAPRAIAAPTPEPH